MKEAASSTFTNHKGEPGAGVVWLSFDGHYIPESATLGMGHNYPSAKRAVDDLLFRHGATLIEFSPSTTDPFES